MYYDYREPLKKAAGHRVLAMNRGEKEGFLSVKIEGEEEKLLQGWRKGSSAEAVIPPIFCARLSRIAISG